MKKMIVAAFMLGMFATNNAKATNTTTPAAVTVKLADDGEKTQIDPASLPEAVKATLATDAYKDWKISSAWAVKAEQAYYEVELKKDDKTNAVKINSDGKVK